MPTRKESICPVLFVSFTNTRMRVYPRNSWKNSAFLKDRLDSREARIKADFSYPMVQQSLRIGLEGINITAAVSRFN